MIEERMQTYSIEAEQSLLGGLLLSNDAYDRIGSTIREDMFYTESHRIIYGAITALLSANRPADVLTVQDALKISGKLDFVGGLAYLGEIANNTPSAANIARYAEIISERFILRNLVAAGASIQDLALSADGRSIHERLARAMEIVTSIGDKNSARRSYVTLEEATVDYVTYLANDEQPENPYKTGLTDLDSVLTTIGPATVVTIAGRPGMGKSTLAMQIADHLDTTLPGDGGVIVIFTLEMAASQQAKRVIARRQGIAMDALQSRRLQDHEYSKITQHMIDAQKSRIVIDDNFNLTKEDLRISLSKLKRKYGQILAVVVDYLQLMAPSGRGENRTQELSDLTRTIKNLSGEFQCPIFQLSQLNRALEQRPNKRPIMADLRESGSIEQDSDIILFVYREEIYTPDTETERGVAEIIVGKQRDGATGIAKVAFQGKYNRFANLDIAAYESYKAQYGAKDSKPSRRGFS